MPRGPQGQKRPADTNACAVHVCRIATGEIEEEAPTPRQRANAQNGRAGGKARAEQVDPERRRQIARQGAEARWKNRA